MRHFTSYGPSEPKAHFCVERRELVERCIDQLVGSPEEVGGHYFTIWGPRQTGKTWVMWRAIEEIRKRYGDRFIVGKMSMQGVIINENQPTDVLLEYVPQFFDVTFERVVATPANWRDFSALFRRGSGEFGDKPVILLIDEFDKLRPDMIDRMVSLFRDMYLARESYVLHGLALIGVRAVLGVDSARGSPFNVQRSLPIPNLTRDEVIEMFRQYQTESAQLVEPNVVQAVFDSTRGQPGLVGWFGELLTEKYNPGKDKPIAENSFRRVYSRALHVEWNNTVLNLVKKARGEYRGQVLRLFTDPNVSFSLDKDWCNFLYMNGIIEESVLVDTDILETERVVCRFSSPFVQLRLYAALTDDMFGENGPLPAIRSDDLLSDVFTEQGLCLWALLERYRDYLKRLKSKGIDPWIGQPRRQDLHYTEAVGHFHLYAWLHNAIGHKCSISPEFPTGNGRVDLLVRSKFGTGLLEVKSLTDRSELVNYRKQAAGYAQKLGLTISTLVVFAPTDEDAVLEKLVGDDVVDGIRVLTVPFGWV